MKKLSLILALIFLVSGCAMFQKVENPDVKLFKSLEASAVAYNAAREGLRQYDAKHPIDEGTKAKIEEYAADYRLAYHLAIESWELYQQHKGTQVEWFGLAHAALDMLARFEKAVPNE